MPINWSSVKKRGFLPPPPPPPHSRHPVIVAIRDWPLNWLSGREITENPRAWQKLDIRCIEYFRASLTERTSVCSSRSVLNQLDKWQQNRFNKTRHVTSRHSVKVERDVFCNIFLLGFELPHFVLFLVLRATGGPVLFACKLAVQIFLSTINANSSHKTPSLPYRLPSRHSLSPRTGEESARSYKTNCDLDLSEVFSPVYFHPSKVMPIFWYFVNTPVGESII